MTLKDLHHKWQNNSLAYQQHEIGSGIQDFISDIFLSSELFNLTKVAKNNGKTGVFTHDTVKKIQGRPDFVLFINKDVTIPVEVKCFGKIEEGINQILRYQLDYSKQYGILTDGNEWRFYRAGHYHKYFLSDIFEKSDEFITFWNDYIKSEHYYIELFNPTEQQNLFESKIDLNDAENRKIFFDDTTKLISNFRIKLNLAKANEMTEKQEVETVYSYLIQFILFKVIVDNGFKNFTNWYKSLFRLISRYLFDSENYQSILGNIKMIADYVSTHIYKPFGVEQENINRKIFYNLKTDLNIDDISAWLDIIVFIDKYNFGNLKNEIFGFIYENYLKDLYGDKNKGQYFTDPEVVNLMLDEMGYTTENLNKDPNKISIIDPACGAGTFLYSAVNKIIETFAGKYSKRESDFVKNLVSKNIFGLDIEEFPLYLAEMSIIMKMLPLIISGNYDNPIDEKIKIFKTKDSISEFLDAGIGAINPAIDYPTLFLKTGLGYESFMRDDKNLQEMLESMQGRNGARMRFDFVVGNPPYISYKDCSILGIPFMNNKELKMNDVYGVNLHSIPSNIKKYAPTPNLYAFFVALGLALLKDDGKLCFIIPQTVLIAEALDVIRYHLAKNTTIEKIITFGGNLFINRGLSQKRAVSTSSLIFVAKKSAPEKHHKVNIINYQPYNDEKYINIEDYLNSKKRENSIVLQSVLLEKVENWNFLKNKEKDNIFSQKYIENSVDISCYYNHALAKEHFGEQFYFDRGLKYPRVNITNFIEFDMISHFLFIPEINKYKTKTQKTESAIAKSLLNFPHGSQGIEVYNKKYKIIWRYMNYDKFRFSDDQIMIDYNNVLISSDCKSEMLYLLAILNSKITEKIIKFYLHLDNEQDLTLGIKSIKQYIRIPKITPENQHIKARIIELTERMLDIETITLSDLVDFKNFTVQRFDNVQVVGNHLVLHYNNKEYKLEITKDKTEFVKKIISDNYYDNSLIFKRKEVSLQELLNLETIDFDQQTKIKTEIDELVGEMYQLRTKLVSISNK